MDFIVTDESLNKYGFRVLTDGIDTSEFEKNPILFYNHERFMQMPIGRWENLRREGDKMMATAVFDEGDETAMDVKRKIEGKFLNAASIGIAVLEWSDDPANLVPGQTRATVTKSRLREISIVDIPANGNAMRLFDNTNMLQLSAQHDGGRSLESFLPKIKDMKKVAIALGLADDANEEAVLAALKHVQSQLAAGIEFVGKVASERGFKPETVQKLAASDLSAVADLVLGKPAEGNAAPNTEVRLSEAIKEAMKANAPQAQHQKEVRLSELPTAEQKRLLQQEPEKYADLFFKDYGYKPTLEELKKLV